jgi:tight adherence protein B
MAGFMERSKKQICLSTKANLKQRDYKIYYWNLGELILDVALSFGAVVVTAYFFYRSAIAVILLSPIGIFFFRQIYTRKKKACVDKLTMEFKECILSVSTALKAGYAVENAFLESLGDMKLLYGEASLIYNELEFIRRGLIINITLEELLENLAERSGSMEIRQFARIFAIAKRNGGNIPEIIRTSSELIGDKIDTYQEIRTVLSGRRMEQNIMKIMPFAILAYIGISYPGYFDALYHNVKGILIMTLCLGIYIFAYITGDRILDRIEREMM